MTVSQPAEMICARADCRQPFVAHPRNQRTQRYCSTACREADQHASPLRHLTSATAGALCELLAAADLLKRGYDVFRAVSPACSCDLIAVRDSRMLQIEVRAGRRNSATGRVYWCRSRPDTADHYCVVVDSAELFYFPPLSPDSNG